MFANMILPQIAPRQATLVRLGCDPRLIPVHGLMHLVQHAAYVPSRPFRGLLGVLLVQALRNVQPRHVDRPEHAHERQEVGDLVRFGYIKAFRVHIEPRCVLLDVVPPFIPARPSGSCDGACLQTKLSCCVTFPNMISLVASRFLAVEGRLLDAGLADVFQRERDVA